MKGKTSSPRSPWGSSADSDKFSDLTSGVIGGAVGYIAGQKKCKGTSTTGTATPGTGKTFTKGRPA